VSVRVSGARHFLDLDLIEPAALRTILDEAHRRKRARAGKPKGAPDDDAPLAGHVLAAIFEKSSTRTRVSFDIAMRQLGGGTMTLTAADMQLGRGETVEDTAKVLSRMVDAAMIRAIKHDTVTASPMRRTFRRSTALPTNRIPARSWPIS
jgi:ornithine carbamoyltransferase